MRLGKTADLQSDPRNSAPRKREENDDKESKRDGCASARVSTTQLPCPLQAAPVVAEAGEANPLGMQIITSRNDGVWSISLARRSLDE